MPDKRPVLKRRLAPSVPLVIDIKDENDVVTDKIHLRVGFDFNVLGRIEEKSGIRMLGLDMWTKLDARLLGIMLWAACLPYNPEFNTKDGNGNDTDEGLRVMQSYLDKTEAEKATDALWDAYMLYLPREQRELMRKIKAQGETAPDPQNETATTSASTGSTSGPSDDASDSAMAKSAS